jgi:MFS family permease
VQGEGGKDSRGWNGVKTFLKESFCDKWYWLFFAWNTISALGAGISIFTVFFNKEMGLSLEDIGKLGAYSGIAVMAAAYLAAAFVDRWHPMRVLVYAYIFMAAAAFSSWVWIFVTLPGQYYFWLSLCGGLIAVFFITLTNAAGFPTQMRVFPKSRFGQFCSAQAMMRSLFSLVAGAAAGAFVDVIAWLFRYSGNGPGFVYRFNFMWSGFFAVVTGVFSVWAYVYWHRLGAYYGYKPPAPWSPKGTEDLDIVPTIGPQLRWLNLSLRLFDAIMWLSVLGVLPMMWWMHQRGAAVALQGYATMVLPCSLAVWIAWKLLERGIRRDIARCLKNEPLHNGIPHHGVLMVISVQYLLALGIWVAQVIVTIKLNMEWECIVFGIANIVTNMLLTLAVLVIWRMERGRSTTLETDADEASDLPSDGVAC